MPSHEIVRVALGCLLGVGLLASIAWGDGAKDLKDPPRGEAGNADAGNADGSGAGAGKAEVLPQPDPALTPQQVVRAVVDAMARNDQPSPDAGIRTAFNFASPANRKVTGPIEKFIPMVKNPAYQPMLDHKSAAFGPMDVDGDDAEQVVALTGANGDKAWYVFQLSRQAAGRYKGCWMTDGVIRVQPVAPEPGENAPGDEGKEGPAKKPGEGPIKI